jgi:hypothetical protein
LEDAATHVDSLAILLVLVLTQDIMPIYLRGWAAESWRLEELTEPAFVEVLLVDHAQQPVTSVAAQTTSLVTVKRKL